MKRISTLLMASMAVLGAFAQQEVGIVDAASFTSEAEARAAGTVVAQSESITMTIGAEDNYKQTGAASNGFSSFFFGETDLGSSAIQGSSNPKDINSGNPDATLLPPATGAFFTFEVRKDGYLYFFHKASSHKSYTVFEEGAAIGYTFAMNTANDVLGEVFSFELKGEGEFNNIPEGTAIQWPEKYSPNYANEQIGVSGMGVIKFPVYKDCKYNVNAGGSKIQCAAFGFDTDGATPVYIKGEKTLYLLNTPAALNTVNMNANVVSSQYFLLSGAQVAAPSADAKGLYIVKNFMSDGSVRVEKMVIR